RLVPALSPEVDAFFERALAKEPSARFQSAEELAEAFEALSGRAASELLLDGESDTLADPPVDVPLSDADTQLGVADIPGDDDTELDATVAQGAVPGSARARPWGAWAALAAGGAMLAAGGALTWLDGPAAPQAMAGVAPLVVRPPEVAPG